MKRPKPSTAWKGEAFKRNNAKFFSPINDSLPDWMVADVNHG